MRTLPSDIAPTDRILPLDDLSYVRGRGLILSPLVGPPISRRHLRYQNILPGYPSCVAHTLQAIQPRRLPVSPHATRSYICEKQPHGVDETSISSLATRADRVHFTKPIPRRPPRGHLRSRPSSVNHLLVPTPPAAVVATRRRLGRAMRHRGVGAGS